MDSMRSPRRARCAFVAGTLSALVGGSALFGTAAWADVPVGATTGTSTGTVGTATLPTTGTTVGTGTTGTTVPSVSPTVAPTVAAATAPIIGSTTGTTTGTVGTVGVPVGGVANGGVVNGGVVNGGVLTGTPLTVPVTVSTIPVSVSTGDLLGNSSSGSNNSTSSGTSNSNSNSGTSTSTTTSSTNANGSSNSNSNSSSNGNGTTSSTGGSTTTSDSSSSTNSNSNSNSSASNSSGSNSSTSSSGGTSTTTTGPLNQVQIDRSTSAVYPAIDGENHITWQVRPLDANGNPVPVTGTAYLVLGGRVVKAWAVDGSTTSITWDGLLNGQIVPGTYSLVLNVHAADSTATTSTASTTSKFSVSSKKLAKKVLYVSRTVSSKTKTVAMPKTVRTARTYAGVKVHLSAAKGSKGTVKYVVNWGSGRRTLVIKSGTASSNTVTVPVGSSAVVLTRQKVKGGSKKAVTVVYSCRTLR